MRAYKVLIDGRSGFTGYRWPLPTGGAPGEWVTATGPLELCGNGVHACTVGQLAQWIGEELWTIELGGEILAAEAALVAARGRLLGPVAAWDRAAREAFGQACARRAHEPVDATPASAPLLEAIDRFAAAGRAGPAAYWAAVLAGERVAGMRSGPEYDVAFGRERAAQAAWLESALGAPG